MVWSALAVVLAAAPARVQVGPGTYRPIYPPSPSETELPVRAFQLDAEPVTNEAFAAFVAKDPRWRRDRVKRLFADPGYLKHWAAPDRPGREQLAQPVVFVSWFAARAFCASRGGRLPSEAEWEFAAAADATQVDARKTPAFRDEVLTWYTRPAPSTLPAVGQGRPNLWGARDLHGLVWEWVDDFGSTLVSSDSRDDKDPTRKRFCGAGAADASEKDDYPSFMRIAFRSALEAAYAVGNLGFRCAYDLEGKRR